MITSPNLISSLGGINQSLLLEMLYPSILRIPFSQAFLLPHRPDLEWLRTQKPVSFSNYTLPRMMTWSYPMVLNTSHILKNFSSSDPISPSLLETHPAATSWIANTSHTSTCTMESQSLQFQTTSLPVSPLPVMQRTDFCREKKEPIVGVQSRDVCGLELCHGKEKQWAHTRCSWQGTGWGGREPGANSVYVTQARLGEKDRVNLTSKTVKGKQQETFWGPKRMCFTAYYGIDVREIKLFSWESF